MMDKYKDNDIFKCEACHDLKPNSDIGLYKERTICVDCREVIKQCEGASPFKKIKVNPVSPQSLIAPTVMALVALMNELDLLVGSKRIINITKSLKKEGLDFDKYFNLEDWG